MHGRKKACKVVFTLSLLTLLHLLQFFSPPLSSPPPPLPPASLPELWPLCKRPPNAADVRRPSPLTAVGSYISSCFTAHTSLQCTGSTHASPTAVGQTERLKSNLPAGKGLLISIINNNKYIISFPRRSLMKSNKSFNNQYLQHLRPHTCSSSLSLLFVISPVLQFLFIKPIQAVL